MSAISELCGRAIWLRSGEISLDGLPSDVITAYVISGNYHAQVDLATLSHYGPQQYARLLRVSLMDEDRRLSTSFFMNKPLIAQIEIECHRLMKNAEVGLKISSRQGTAIHYLTSTWEGLRGDLEPGRYLFEVTLPRLLLFPGKYRVGVWALREGETSDDNVQEATYFEVVKGEVTEYPTTIEKYCFSGCEVFTPSSWNLTKHGGGAR
jgi:lipopolysaccharide transport system ATP-binding protein